MTAITLTNHELLQLKLLLRDIQLIQKMDSPFDNEAIEILSFKIIEHLNNHETYGSKGSDETNGNNVEKVPNVTSSQTEISDEEITKYVKSNNPYPSTKQGSVDWEHGFITAIEWYRKQLKKKG